MEKNQPLHCTGDFSTQVSPEAFRATAKKAYGAASRLLILVTPELRADQMDKIYASFAGQDEILGLSADDVEEPDSEDEERCAGATVEKEATAEEVFKQLQSSQQKQRDEECAAETAVQLDDVAAQKIEDAIKTKANRRGAPSETIQRATEAAVGSQVEQTFPHMMVKKGRATLAGALAGHVTFEAAKADLVRLVHHLVSGKDGAHAFAVKDHWAARRAGLNVKGMRWHDQLRHDLAVAQTAQEASAQRTSREQAWRAQSSKASSQEGVPRSLQIDTGDIVAVCADEGWAVGLVLSKWRCYKGSGGRLCYGIFPRGALHSARIVLLAGVDDRKYKASSTSPVAVVEVLPEYIGPLLETETVQKGYDGFVCVLSHHSEKAGARAVTSLLSLQAPA